MISDFINKEKFKDEDIKRYQELNDIDLEYGSQFFEKGIVILEIEKDVEHIKLPAGLFYNLICQHSPRLIQYLPFEIKLKKMDRGNSYWRKYSNYIGIYGDGVLELS